MEHPARDAQRAQEMVNLPPSYDSMLLLLLVKDRRSSVVDHPKTLNLCFHPTKRLEENQIDVGMCLFR